MKYIRKLKVVIAIGVLAIIFITINTIKAYTNYQKPLKESSTNITKTDKMIEIQFVSDKDIKVNLNNNESSTVYSYSQKAYYQKPYIIWTGWNLSEKLFGYYYPHKTKEIELSDGTNLIVSFEKPCLEYMDNQEFISTLTELLEKLKAENANSSRPLEKPLVAGVEYIGDKDVTELAEEYYTNEKLAHFSSILESLDVDLINTYAQKAYSEDKLVYFSATVPYMTDDIKKDWIEKCFKDGRAAFSGVLR